MSFFYFFAFILSTLVSPLHSLSHYPLTSAQSQNKFNLTLKELNLSQTKYVVDINLTEQTLKLYQGHTLLKEYPISSGKNGAGQKERSGKTPLGLHTIGKKIGHNAPLYTIFTGKAQTKKICKPTHQKKGHDYVLTRILVLKGLQKGFNKGFDLNGCCVDSYKRMIYIHGTPYESLIGQPESKGCIRMKNADILVLFEKVEKGSHVWIHY